MTSRSWCAVTAPGPAPGWPGTCANARSPLRSACRSTPMSARRSWPNPSRPGPRDRPSGQVRPSAEVCELTGWIDLHTWPAGTRAICRREDAHPGAQLRFSDHDGHRFQVFLTDQADPDITRLELRPRQHARVEDRIRAAKATGLGNLPFDLLPQRRLAGAGPGRPRHCATGCCTSPPASSAMPAARSCGCSAPGHGPLLWRARSLGCRPCRCAANPPSNADGLPPDRGHATLPTSRLRHPPSPHASASSPRTPFRTPPRPPDSRPGDRHHALMKSRG